MIFVDANILLYSEDSLSEHHDSARRWWDEQLSGTTPVALSWPVITAFIRIATNPRLQQRPLTLREAIDRVRSWLEQACVRILVPTDDHWRIFQEMLHAGSATGNLVTDARLAALAVEHNCTLYSADSDFARFRSLAWKNPL